MGDLQFDNLRPGTQLRVDGHVGARTETAVLKFQELRKLEADGVVGARTWAALGQREPQVAAPQVIDAIGAPWFTIAMAEKGIIANNRPGEHRERILEYHRATTLKASTDERSRGATAPRRREHRDSRQEEGL